MKLDKVIDFISFALLIITLLLLKVTSGYVENIILGRKFVLYYFLLGLTISVVWTCLMYKFKPGYYEGGEKRASAILSQFFSIIILTIFLNAFYTYHTGKGNLYYKEAILIERSSNITHGTDYVNLLIDGRNERFNPGQDEFKNLAIGDTLSLTICKGKTDYEVIYHFNRKQHSLRCFMQILFLNARVTHPFQ